MPEINPANSFHNNVKKKKVSPSRKRKPQTKLQITFSTAFKFLRKMTEFLKERPLVSDK